MTWRADNIAAQFKEKKKYRKCIAKGQVESTHCTIHDGESSPTAPNLHYSASYPMDWKVVAFHF